MLDLQKLLQPPVLSPTLKAYGSVASVAGTTVIASYINGAITVALPSIAKSLPLATNQLQWPLSMLALTNGAFLLIGGGLADSFGRRRCFLIGTAFTGIIGLITAFTDQAEIFILMCAFLGLGGALLTPSGVGIIGASLPDGKFKNLSFSALGAGQPVGFIVGLVLGGLLAENWKTIFYVLTGLSFSFLFLAWLTLPFDDEVISPYGIKRSSNSSSPDSNSILHLTSQNHSQTNSRNQSSMTLNQTPNPNSNPTDLNQNLRKLPISSFDWFGSLLSTSGLILLTFALADAESAPKGWKTPYIPTLLPISILLLVGFFYWESYLEKIETRKENGETFVERKGILKSLPLPRGPLLPPSLFKSPNFGTVLATVFCAWLSFNTLSYFSTLMFQEVQHLSPIKTSLSFLPMIGSGLLLYSFAGFLVARLSAVWIIITGCGGGAIACALYCFVNQETIYVKGMLWVMILIVFTDLSFPACQLFACSTVGKNRAALAGSLFNTTTRLGTSLGLAITSSVSSSVTRTYANKHSISIESELALTKGYHAVGWLCFGFSITSILIALIFLRDIGVVGGAEEKIIITGNSNQSQSRSRIETERIGNSDFVVDDSIEIGNGTSVVGNGDGIGFHQNSIQDSKKSKIKNSRPSTPNGHDNNENLNDKSDYTENIALKRIRSQIPKAAHLRSYSEDEVQRAVG